MSFRPLALALAALTLAPALLPLTGGSPPAAPMFAAPVILFPQGGGALVGGEPNIRVTPQDHVLVTTWLEYEWRSADGGASFAPVGTKKCLGTVCKGWEYYDAGIRGGGDGALDVDPATGTFYWLGLADSDGNSIPFQRSLDDGRSWSAPIDLAAGRSTDRQWIGVAPDGAVVALWRDSDADGVILRVSTDGGVTWGPDRVVAPGFPVTGHVVFDAAGNYYVPVDSGFIELYKSGDRGATWTHARVPSRDGRADVGLTRFIFPEAAVDAAGTVYVVWADDASFPQPFNAKASLATKGAESPQVWLSTSTDGGAHFSAARRLNAPGTNAVLPAIVAGAAGRVAVSFYETAIRAGIPSDTAPQLWNLAFVQTIDGGATFTEAYPATNVHTGAISTNGLLSSAYDRTRGDFMELTLRPNGYPILAYVADPADPTVNAQQADVVTVRMTGGTPLR